MHSDHDIFVQAMRDKRKVKLTFSSKEHGGRADKLCGPVFYSASAGGDDSGCYYLWDFESSSGNHFLVLPPSQIVGIELAEEHFDLIEFLTSGREISDSQYEAGADSAKT